MNGALSRILGKSRGAPPVVRPRLPSLWETGPVSREEVDEATSSPIRAQPAALTSHETGTGARAVPAPPRVMPAVPLPERTSSSDPAEPQVVERRIETRVERRVEEEPAAARPVEAAAPPPRQTGPHGRPPERPETRVEHTVVRVEGQPPAPVQAPRITEVVREHEIAKQQAPPARVQVQPVEIRAARPVVAPPVPHHEPRRSRQPAEPPVIRVTIGRVDVRAVPEAPAPHRVEKRESSRRLELDEYLKRRRGER